MSASCYLLPICIAFLRADDLYMSRFSTMQAKRGEIVAVDCVCQEVWQASLEMQQLQRNLGQERLAVHTFLFTVCQEVGTQHL